MKIAQFQFSLFGINTYVVWDPETRQAAIIDPGMSLPEEVRALDDFISREGLTVTNIINTHLHIDHSIGNAIAAGKYGAPVLAHADDEPLGKHTQDQARMFGMGGDYQPVEISTYLKDGDVVKVGNGSLLVMHAPGHSPGHIVLYDKADGVLFAGDVLFKGSIGRTDLPGGNHRQLLDSISLKLLQLPDDTIVYPGHGPATTIGDERRLNPFLQ